jgi:hypothetical protein
METGAVLVFSVHLGAGHDDVAYVAMVDVLHKLRECEFLLFRSRSASLYYLPKQHSGKQNHQPERYSLNG